MSATVAVDVHLAAPDWADVLAAEVRDGLTGSPKVLSPVWFYDERGSELFDEITRLDEYYPTRAERAILEAHAGDIARRTGATTLVELGSGTSDKTRLLLDALAEAGTLQRFVPFDVSEETLRTAAASIAGEYELDVRAVVGDFHRHLGLIPREGRRMVAFLGGTIGNLDPIRRRAFFDDLRAAMDDDEWLLLGTDLVKDPRRSSPPTTTPTGSRPSSTATCSWSWTGSWTPTSTRRPSTTSPSGTPTRRGSRCACVPARTSRSASTSSTST